MDAWTSPNHQACVAWSVHLHHKGHILVFLLDIVEVPEECLLLMFVYLVVNFFIQPHTGEALACVFHNMLVAHGIENKV
jgi:hypothetical protein